MIATTTLESLDSRYGFTHQLLAKSSHAHVELVIDVATKVHYAAKTFRCEDEGVRRIAEVMFEKEQEVRRRLGTDAEKYVVGIRSVGFLSGLPCIVMDYHPATLDHQIDGRGIFPPEQALGIMRSIARCVAGLHLVGIVHRDIKPGNILATHGGNYLLTDLATAALNDLDRVSSLVLPCGSRVETLFSPGTPVYMAPEQLRGDRESLSPAADVYAMAVILYQLLTGFRPYEGSGIERVRAIRSNRPLVSPRSIVPTIPRDVERVCLSGLAEDPQARYPDASAFLKALEEVGNTRKSYWSRVLPTVPKTVQKPVAIVATAHTEEESRILRKYVRTGSPSPVPPARVPRIALSRKLLLRGATVALSLGVALYIFYQYSQRPTKADQVPEKLASQEAVAKSVDKNPPSPIFSTTQIQRSYSKKDVLIDIKPVRFGTYTLSQKESDYPGDKTRRIPPLKLVGFEQSLTVDHVDQIVTRRFTAFLRKDISGQAMDSWDEQLNEEERKKYLVREIRPLQKCIDILLDAHAMENQPATIKTLSEKDRAYLANRLQRTATAIIGLDVLDPESLVICVELLEKIASQQSELGSAREALANQAHAVFLLEKLQGHYYHELWIHQHLAWAKLRAVRLAKVSNPQITPLEFMCMQTHYDEFFRERGRVPWDERTLDCALIHWDRALWRRKLPPPYRDEKAVVADLEAASSSFRWFLKMQSKGEDETRWTTAIALLELCAFHDAHGLTELAVKDSQLATETLLSCRKSLANRVDLRLQVGKSLHANIERTLKLKDDRAVLSKCIERVAHGEGILTADPKSANEDNILVMLESLRKLRAIAKERRDKLPAKGILFMEGFDPPPKIPRMTLPIRF